MKTPLRCALWAGLMLSLPGLATAGGIALLPAGTPELPAASQPPMKQATASNTTPAVGSMDEVIQSGSKGYWFYKNHPKQRPVTPPYAPPPRPKVPPRCQSDVTWTADCGFVKPTTFAMQSHERDALLQQMVMHPEDPKNVMAVQEYTNWMFHQAAYTARVWQYNETQHARKFDPAATNPISGLGLQLARQIGATDQKAVWQAVKGMGGFLVMFTKDDCDYCESEVPALQGVVRDTKLPVWDASIGGECLSAFKKSCMTVEQSTLPARILHVDLVPAVFLYLPDDVWIKVSAGLTPSGVIEDRLYNLFISWKLAATKIAKETGNTGLALDPSAMPKDTQALKALLEKAIPKASGGGS